MGGEICKKRGRERGPWFEIKCISETIRALEAKGRDATFERDLLKSWSRYEGYERAKEALSALV